MIVDEFNGNLISVAFRKTDQYFVVPFPISVVAVNQSGEATKQYLICMEYAIDDSDESLKREGFKKIVKYTLIKEPSLKMRTAPNRS